MQHSIPEPKLRPLPIAVPHSVLPQDPSLALIVATDKKEGTKEYIRAHPELCVSKILTVDSLKEKHHTYADRRKLERSYDLFLADARLYAVLPSLLGATFFRRNKFPLMVEAGAKGAALDDELLATGIREALGSTTLQQPEHGRTALVRIGFVSMSPTELTENAKAVIAALADPERGIVPLGARNIRSLMVKTPHSPAFPLFEAEPVDLAAEFQQTESV